MNIPDTGLSKKAQAVLNVVDSFIRTYDKNRGFMPEKLTIKQADYESILKSVTKETKENPASLERKGVKIIPAGGVI